VPRLQEDGFLTPESQIRQPQWNRVEKPRKKAIFEGTTQMYCVAEKEEFGGWYRISGRESFGWQNRWKVGLQGTE